MDTRPETLASLTCEWSKFSLRPWVEDPEETERLDGAWQREMALEGAIQRWCTRLEDWIVQKVSSAQRLFVSGLTEPGVPAKAFLLAIESDALSKDPDPQIMGTGDLVDALAQSGQTPEDLMLVRGAVILLLRLLLDTERREAFFPRLSLVSGRVPERHVFIRLKVSPS